MGRYRKTFRLDAPIEDVWALMADPERLTEWNGAFDDVIDATGRLDGVGTTYTQVMRVAGLELTGRWEITGVEPGRRREFSGTPPGLTTCDGVETFEDLGDATEYTVEMTYSMVGGPLSGVVDQVLGRALVARVIERNIDALRRLLGA